MSDPFVSQASLGMSAPPELSSLSPPPPKTSLEFFRARNPLVKELTSISIGILYMTEGIFLNERVLGSWG